MTATDTQDSFGLIISYFGSSVAVLADNGQVFPCQLRRNQDLPVVGDRVRWHLDKDQTGTISDILPRRSLFARGDGHGKMKPIAANIDYILIVMAPPPVMSEYLIDRYLIAAELLNIKPMIVLNKMDLLQDREREAVKTRLAQYESIPYQVIFSSTKEPGGLDQLSAALKAHSAVLVGPSGVGKSSIIRSLGENLDIRVAAVSPKGAGKHTTTATHLYPMKSGGFLIDSPGVREFSLWPVSKKDVLRGFPEFKQYSGDCKFRDCAHLVEPGCQVIAAEMDGKISAKRRESYKELLKVMS